MLIYILSYKKGTCGQCFFHSLRCLKLIYLTTHNSRGGALDLLGKHLDPRGVSNVRYDMYNEIVCVCVCLAAEEKWNGIWKSSDS